MKNWAKIRLTRNRIDQFLFRPCVFSENQCQIVDCMLIRLLGIKILQCAMHLLFDDFKSLRAKFEIEQLINDFAKEDLLFVTVAANRQLKATQKKFQLVFRNNSSNQTICAYSTIQLTLIPCDVLLTPNRKPANSASYKYSFNSSLNSCTNMCVKLQLSGSE